MTENQIDILIIGAGPVGLFCVNELSRYGLTCRIIDKKAELSQCSNALTLHTRTLYSMEKAGFIDEILKEGHKIDGIVCKANEKNLFNACFDIIKTSRPYLINLPQNKLEYIFHQRLTRQGIKVEWQTELVSIEQTSINIIATLKHANDQIETINVGWVIACDGAHGDLKHLIPTHHYDLSYRQSKSWWVADLFIDWNVPSNQLFLLASEHGALACFPMSEHRYRVIMPVSVAPSENPSFEDLEKEFKKRTTEQATLSNPVWVKSFPIVQHQLNHYIHGRIFFTGDAAYADKPTESLGLNAGLEDSYNLVWKLALVQHNLAQASLLHSYHSERYPVGQQLLEKIKEITKIITLSNQLLIKLRNRILRFLFSFTPIKEAILTDLTGLTISYAKSPLVKQLGTRSSFKIGQLVPNFSLMSIQENTSKSLYEIIQGTLTHHLFLFVGQQNNQFPLLLEIATRIRQQFRGIVEPHLVLINSGKSIPSLASLWIDQDAIIHQQFAIKKATALLIRPDQYIGATQTPIKLKSLFSYLSESLHLLV